MAQKLFRYSAVGMGVGAGVGAEVVGFEVSSDGILVGEYEGDNVEIVGLYVGCIVGSNVG